MKAKLSDYASIGIVHHMIYPECMQHLEIHEKTLSALSRRGEFETLDCCLPFGEERRQRLHESLRSVQKEIVYALHMFPLRKIALASAAPHEQEIARMIVRDQIEQAAAIGATGFIFASGIDMPDDREGAKARIAEFTRWFCAELARYSMTALLEPFDREIDKKFLLGPSVECVEFVEQLRGSGVDNLAIELDMAHVPLMGETFEQAIRTVRPYLQRVHLGNCVLRDHTHPLYGDTHPPIGYEAGEIGTPQLAHILELLLSCGYLDRDRRGALVLEMIPFPGESAEYTIADSLRRLDEAWAMV